VVTVEWGVAPKEPDNFGIRNILILRNCKNDLAPTELNLIGNDTAIGLGSYGAPHHHSNIPFIKDSL
jgi:hypothetical protein